jgi:hypothetical protein
MPFILPAGKQIQIDFFNVIKGTNVVAEYFYGGIMIVTQTMPIETASIFASALCNEISDTFFVPRNEQITFEIKSDKQNILIFADSFMTKSGTTHMEIDYLLKSDFVLSQRTSIQTLRSIAEEIR